ncbi:hypothetical protein QZH41_013223 [Actinostola sp. cb2023]|nr:hypothetical protein QZH41_013223 [Actinostola sp. cb2023]
MEDERSFDANSNPNEKVVINVGGQKHETYSNTLKSIPDTRLYWITENPTQLAEYDPNTQEYFFDRHPGVFAQVLNFYRTGKLHCPNDVCGPLFEEELAFWGIDELQVEPCCWLNYKKHREAQAQLDPFEGRESDGDSVEDMDMTIYGLVGDSIRRRNRTCWKKYQPKIWTLFEEPYSSVPAQIVAFVTLLLIISSVAVFCLETMPYFSEPNTAPSNSIFYIEAICVAAFTVEFFIRLIVCPNKVAFAKMPMNWIDFGAILPFYLQLSLNKSNVQTIVVFRVVRLIRVFRIFKLSRHSYGLQILGHTLKSSCSELFLLAFFLSIGVIIFSSIIYYAEKDEDKTCFKTIPDGFWWAVVTMTTLGYGDMVPITWQGKIVGSLCAVSGVLMIALPVPVIVSNFSLYYSHAKARMFLPKRKRPLIFGAASALRVAQPFAVSERKPNVITQLMEERARDEDDPENPSAMALRTPQSSGRFSPLSGTRSPITTHPSPRRSVSELNENGTLIVPEIHSYAVEPNERENNMKNPCVPHPIPLVVLSTSGELSPRDTASLPKSPGSSRHTGSVISLSDKSHKFETKSLASKKRAIQAKSLSADSSSESPRGRRGRRSSVYIVGFTAKHWQNKALHKDKTDRKALSADNSTEKYDTKPRGICYSLSCENCDGRSRARSAEVLLRSVEGSEHVIDNASGPRPRRDSVIIQSNEHVIDNASGHRPRRDSAIIQSNEHVIDNASGHRPRRDSAIIQSNSPIITHKSLTRISSGTQTSATTGVTDTGNVPYTREILSTGDVPGINEIARTESRKTISNPTVEHDPSSKAADDSLCVHRLLNQRRGSSPLRRQHAVFTFEQPPESNPISIYVGQLQADQLAPVRVVHQATSPTLPSSCENIPGTLEPRDNGDKSRDLPSPPFLDGRRSSSSENIQGTIEPRDNGDKNRDSPSPPFLGGRRSSLSENIPGTIEPRDSGDNDDGDKNRDSPSPPFVGGRRSSVRNSKVRPKPSSYVNASYQKEDDDSISHPSHLRYQSFDSHRNNGRLDSPTVERRGFQPYHKNCTVHAIPSLATPVQTHLTEPVLGGTDSKDQYAMGRRTASPVQTGLTEPVLEDSDGKDQYARGRRTPIGSVSNSSLPSISEEQDGNLVDHSLHPSHKHILYRPHSMPSETFDHLYSTLPSIHRASSLPLRNSSPSDDMGGNYLHPLHAHDRTQTQDEGVKTLLERRQRPDLSIRNTADQTIQVNQLDLVNSPWFRSVLNVDFRTVNGVDRVTSVYGPDRFTSGLSPLPVGEFSLSADDRLLYSPHTPPSSNTPKTRDMATSPFITSWNETEDSPDLLSVKHYGQPSFPGKTGTGFRSASSLSEINSLEGDVRRKSPDVDIKRKSPDVDVRRKSPDVDVRRKSPDVDIKRKSPDVDVRRKSPDVDIKRKSPDVELQPITLVEDQAGRQYTLYAVPTGLEGSVFYSSATGTSINSEKLENTGTQSRTNQNRYQGVSETFGLPSERVRDHFEGVDRTRGNEEASRYEDDVELRSDNSGRLKNSLMGDLTSKSPRYNDSIEHQGRISPRLQRTDDSIVYTGHEPLQQRLSGNVLLTKRSTVLPSPDRRRARTLFFGDSGISSVGSGSTTSMSHSLDLDTESKERKETAANILNPIKETEVENPGNRSRTNRIDPGKTSTASVNIMLPSLRSRESTVIDVLTNSDLYEASVV